MNNLPVEALDFDGIKANLKKYLQSTGKFNDVNFEASGISTIINLLSYNSHYIGYYIKMLMNESFLDTAVLRETLLSKAKMTGYIPKNKRSAKATIKIISYLTPIEYSNLQGNKLIVSKYSTFTGRNASGDLKQFLNLDSYEFTLTGQSGDQYIFESPSVFLTEGRLIEDSYKVTDTDLNRFIIKDSNIDIDTLRVFVQDSPSAILKEFKLASDLFSLDSTSEVFFLTTSELGYYELIFGNNVFGKKLALNNVINVRYISSSGENGNGVSSFSREGVSTNFNDYSLTLSSLITTIDSSSSGLEQESIEDLKYNIPKHNIRQYRLVTPIDIKTFLMNEYRDIDSISVYGGENAYPKEFGKVFVTIKPKYSPVLSTFAKDEIKNKISPYNISGLEVKFKDPTYLNIELQVYTKLISDNIKNPLETKTSIISIINSYNTNTLNRFNVSYSDIDLLSQIKKSTQAILSIYTKKVVYKTFDLLHGDINEQLIDFNSSNPIIKGSVISDTILYNGEESYLNDESGLLYIFSKATGSKILTRSIGTIDYNTSLIKLKPELSFRSKIQFNSYDTYKIYITPQSQDVFGFNDTIVNISSLDVILQ